MFGLHHLDLPFLGGRTETFNHTRQGAEEQRAQTGGDKQKREAELTEGVSISKQVEASGEGGRVKEDRAN